MQRLLSLALLALACGRIDESTSAAPVTGGHSQIPVPAVTGGAAGSPGGVATGGDAFGGGASGAAAPSSGGSEMTPVHSGGMEAGAAPSGGGSEMTPVHSGGMEAAEGGALAASGGASSSATPAIKAGSTAAGSAPDASYPTIIEVPATCANYPADTCGYVSDGFGSIIYCGPCPCAVTCEEVCTSGSPNSVPRCVTDYDAASGYTLECAQSTGCSDGHLRRCWCKRT